METLTVKQVADLMGRNPQFIRVGLQRGIFPWGYAVRMNGRFSYWINKQKFMQYEMKEGDQNHVCETVPTPTGSTGSNS